MTTDELNARILRDGAILRGILQRVRDRIDPMLWEDPYGQVFAQAVLPKDQPRLSALEQEKGLLLLSKVYGCPPALEQVPDWIRKRIAPRDMGLETAAERVRHDHRRFDGLSLKRD
ncbi:hypothetical protein [Acidithiobacillus acidisediminis]|uniref:hypothetical protein n=1 Tax=Acidithiobacillus TaxID=119977 RepID=UPI00200F5A52|nr:hypothetical protein [Acidithiobacillus sp. S30A2]